MTDDIRDIGMRAKAAARLLAQANSEQKNALLEKIAHKLLVKQEEILRANQEDVDEAKNQGLDPAMIDRLSLQGGRVEGIVADVRGVIKLSDPVGEVIEAVKLPNGLDVSRVRTPLGVIAVIYESRPNVTVDVASLGVKTGNALILRGGKETLRTNRVLVGAIQEAIQEAGLPKDAVQLIGSADKEMLRRLLKMHQYVDMVIPRGGAGLHTFCRENSTIPVITGGIGICHLFVDESANLDKAADVVFNAKVQRPTVCNALDTLLVHQKAAKNFIPLIAKKLAAAGVHIHADSEAAALLTAGNFPHKELVQPAVEGDWDREWLSLNIGIKVVRNFDEALEHIHAHSSGHSDGIITENSDHAEKFLNAVDSAAVYVNASTRFTDGGQLGLGAEVAISTQKLHARGPMGLKELTSYKWIVRGDYHVRS